MKPWTGELFSFKDDLGHVEYALIADGLGEVSSGPETIKLLLQRADRSWKKFVERVMREGHLL